MASPLCAELAALWIADGTADAVLARKRGEAQRRVRLAARLAAGAVEDGPVRAGIDHRRGGDGIAGQAGDSFNLVPARFAHGCGERFEAMCVGSDEGVIQSVLLDQHLAKFLRASCPMTAPIPQTAVS